MNTILHCGWAMSPLGWSIVAWKRDILLFLGFPTSEAQGWQELRRQPRLATHWQRDDAKASEWLEYIFFSPSSVLLQPQGTAFQQEVWRTLQQHSRPGETLSYRQLAEYMARPKAYRAVAGALAINPLSWLIPCHRVIHSDGGMQGYRWGLACKQKMLQRECSTVVE